MNKVLKEFKSTIITSIVVIIMNVMMIKSLYYYYDKIIEDPKFMMQFCLAMAFGFALDIFIILILASTVYLYIEEQKFQKLKKELNEKGLDILEF